MLTARYITFYWSSCITHCLNFNVSRPWWERWYALTILRCQVITKYIYNHIYVLNLTKKFTNGTELIHFVQIRFVNNILIMQGIVKQRVTLRQMFSNDNRSAYQETFKRKTSTVVDIIFNYDFWELLRF